MNTKPAGVKFRFTSKDQLDGLHHLIDLEGTRIANAIAVRVIDHEPAAPHGAESNDPATSTKITRTANAEQAEAILDMALVAKKLVQTARAKLNGQPISERHPLDVELSIPGKNAQDIIGDIIGGIAATQIKIEIPEHHHAPVFSPLGTKEPVGIDYTGRNPLMFGMNPDHVPMNLKKLEGNAAGLLVNTLADVKAREYVKKEAHVTTGPARGVI